MRIRAATIHGYIDETQYESQQYCINTQAKNVSIFSRKLTRNYDGKTKYFPVSKASVKFFFSVLGEKNCKKFLGDEVCPIINVNIHACNSAMPMEDRILFTGGTPPAILRH